MKSLNKKTAVVLFNLGGPDSSAAIQPFLFNLFNDKAIISLPQPFRFILAKFISKRRAPKAQKIYDQIGGKSPLIDITNTQAYNLERELSFFGNFKVFVAMRYWKPLVTETVKEIEKYQPDQVILLPLYPQFSKTTSGSSIADFFKNFFKKIPVRTICCYPVEQDFIMSHTLLIRHAIARFYEGSFSQFRLLFSAHGLPQKVIDEGDPYVFQVNESTKKIIKNLQELFATDEKIDFQVCYQSKVGPLRWTSPSLDQEIRRVALDKKTPVIIPISFVSDHSETLVELDIDYKKKAQNLGIKNYIRVPSLNLEGHFIKSLVQICRNVDFNSEEKVLCGGKKQRICPKNLKICPNQNPCKA